MGTWHLDTKGTLMGVMEAAESRSRVALRPKTTYILPLAGMRKSWAATRPPSCRSWNAGASALPLCWTKAAPIVEKVFPGVDQPAALIGIAEKGSAFLDLTAVGKGGHASAPPARQSVGVLARALDRIASHPMPFVLTPPGAGAV